MLDLKIIRNAPELLDKALIRRGKSPITAALLEIDQKNRQFLTELQSLQSQRNQIAKSFGEAKKKGDDTSNLAKQAEEIKAKIGELEGLSHQLQDQLNQELATIPNIPAEDVPLGTDETGNVEIRRFGLPKTFNFEIKSHFEIGEALQLMDFEVAAKISGSRFVVLYEDLARLERALAAFMIDIHTREFSYVEVSPPLLVNEKSVYGTGLLPKFKEDLFQTTTGYWMIPTAEVVLSNLVADSIQPIEALPLRYTAYTPCFRSEAGAAGRDTRGMIRQHQFGKVELVSVTRPEESAAEHERMLRAAEEVLKRLDLPYRVMTLCTGDMGFQSQKTYDIEVWLPSENTYREISSCSNCGDFQARRMNARYRARATAENPKPAPEFVHTLNGSGLAVGRTMVAILENYQQQDGSIIVPEALRSYMGGIELIEKK
ncbi:serine--tRNA ligase [Candidatus Paracaedibacter symbiosus]|uniref:serine--tRNA ligase n=1 Tax=Candidatus Paracaedibacter symbiosus TaxID=244582 RepID=UPI000509C125|nr:serine--tRNA ligase [Candidatus Paracaedibacter symbiosus]